MIYKPVLLYEYAATFFFQTWLGWRMKPHPFHFSRGNKRPYFFNCNSYVVRTQSENNRLYMALNGSTLSNLFLISSFIFLSSYTLVKSFSLFFKTAKLNNWLTTSPGDKYIKRPSWMQKSVAVKKSLYTHDGDYIFLLLWFMVKLQPVTRLGIPPKVSPVIVAVVRKILYL